MSVPPFAPNEGFDPEAIQVIASAFDNICSELGFPTRGDRMSDLVARRIIQAARTGMRDEKTIRFTVLQEFTSNPQ